MSHTGRPPENTPEGRRMAQLNAILQGQLTNPGPVHGNARWISRKQIDQAAAFTEKVFQSPPFDMLLLGEYLETNLDPVAPAFSHGPGHLLTVAGTRAGKGACQIVPNLLAAPYSMLIIDPKGENYAMTARARRQLGPVYRIDPFRVTAPFDKENPFDRYNPLSFLHDDADARRLSSMLLDDPPAQADNARFFYNEAETLLMALLLAAARSDNPTIGNVRDLLAGGDFEERLGRLAKNADRAVARAARMFLNYPEKTRGSILAQINSTTAVWDNAALQNTTSETDFDLADLRYRTATVYVVLPLDRIERFRALLRMMVAQFYSAMLRDGQASPLPVVCLIDEFPALGRMDEIVRALGAIAGFNVRFWLFAQDLHQLRTIYGQSAGTLLANCKTQCFFGISDDETAQWLSESLGSYTRSQLNVGMGQSIGIDPAPSVAFEVDALTSSVSHNTSVQFYGQPLLSRQEILQHLGVGTRFAVARTGGLPPALIRLLPWFEMPELRERGDDLRELTASFVKRVPPQPARWGFIEDD
jgi:type IV secretion system protein VirD4